VLRGGAVVADEVPATLFDRTDLLAEAGIEAPAVARLAHGLRPVGMPEGVTTVDAFSEAYVRLSEGRA
jgi:hypothetical protein